MTSAASPTSWRRSRSAGGEAFWVSADLSTEAGCRDAIAACATRLGGIDILVNVAGAAQQAHVLNELTTELIDDALGLKLYSYLRLSQMAFPYMQAQGWGRIVNIAGAAGTGPTATNLPASFANVNILNMTRALSDVGLKDGILVNTICPGLTNTPRTREHRRVAAQRAGRIADEAEVEAAIEKAGRELPAGRMCEPEEVAKVTCLPRLRSLQLRPGQRHLHGRRRPPRNAVDQLRFPTGSSNEEPDQPQ